MATILLCDDEPGVLFTLEEALTTAGHKTVAVRSGKEALSRLEGIDVVVTDLAMPEMSGLDLLAKLRAIDPELPVLLVTAKGSERTAVQAMKDGAYDYLPKPFRVDELRLVVARAAETRELRRKAGELVIERAIGRPLIGKSAAFRTLVHEATRIAKRDITVLVRGETGTGKELIATLLHAQSARASKPCIRFNCAAIPDDLAEAELFGHAKGAFTGAAASRRGYFSLADGGTLILDEVGELPMGVQSKLLRALQEGEIQPVGAGRIDRVDVRVVGATHRDLLAEVRAGRFREDLYYRLAVVELCVPPLRERREDIPLLAEELCRRYAARFGLDDARLSPSLLAELAARPWPGNVRELENTVARMLALSEGGTLDASALDRVTSARSTRTPLSEASEASEASERAATLRDQVGGFEKALVVRMLGETKGNQSEAARRLGVTRMTLIEKMKRHGIYGKS